MGEVYFSLSHVGRYVMTGYLIINTAKFDPLAKVVAARSLHFKGIISSFPIRKESTLFWYLVNRLFH